MPSSFPGDASADNILAGTIESCVLHEGNAGCVKCDSNVGQRLIVMKARNLTYTACWLEVKVRHKCGASGVYVCRAVHLLLLLLQMEGKQALCIPQTHGAQLSGLRLFTTCVADS